jgi:hypothetical protein
MPRPADRENARLMRILSFFAVHRQVDGRPPATAIFQMSQLSDNSTEALSDVHPSARVGGSTTLTLFSRSMKLVGSPS